MTAQEGSCGAVSLNKTYARLLGLALSAAGNALSAALDNPANWTGDKYRITHAPSGLSFWASNGPFFFDVYDGNFSGPRTIGLIERHLLWRKALPIVKTWCLSQGDALRANFVRQLTGGEQ